MCKPRAGEADEINTRYYTAQPLSDNRTNQERRIKLQNTLRALGSLDESLFPGPRSPSPALLHPLRPLVRFRSAGADGHPMPSLFSAASSFFFSLRMLIWRSSPCCTHLFFSCRPLASYWKSTVAARTVVVELPPPHIQLQARIKLTLTRHRLQGSDTMGKSHSPGIDTAHWKGYPQAP